MDAARHAASWTPQDRCTALTSMLPAAPDVEAPSAPGPKPKEDPTRAVEASNIHRSLGDEANKAWQQVVAGSKSAFSSILSQLTTNRLDNAGVPPQVCSTARA